MTIPDKLKHKHTKSFREAKLNLFARFWCENNMYHWWKFKKNGSKQGNKLISFNNTYWWSHYNIAIWKSSIEGINLILQLEIICTLASFKFLKRFEFVGVIKHHWISSVGIFWTTFNLNVNGELVNHTKVNVHWLLTFPYHIKLIP
jgi:hypothetical protein